MLNLGKGQADVQGATQEVIDQMRSDLTHAIYVFPNAQVPPVTTTIPYYSSETASSYGPYLQMNLVDTVTSASPQSGATSGICGASNGGVSNLSRLDMILAKTDGNSLLTPVQPSYYIVSYYSRRRDVTKPYQPIDNPIVLYRAQIPYYSPDPANPGYLTTTGTVDSTDNNVNADTSNNRYGSYCNNQGSWWLAQSEWGEPNLEPLTMVHGNGIEASAFTIYGSHASMLPTDMGMMTDADYRGWDANTSPPGFVTHYIPPKSTFVCVDSNGDGVIDQVRLSVLLQNTTQMSSTSVNGTQINLPQVVDLPNVRAIANIN